MDYIYVLRTDSGQVYLRSTARGAFNKACGLVNNSTAHENDYIYDRNPYVIHGKKDAVHVQYVEIDGDTSL